MASRVEISERTCRRRPVIAPLLQLTRIEPALFTVLLQAVSSTLLAATRQLAQGWGCWGEGLLLKVLPPKCVAKLEGAWLTSDGHS